MSCDGNRHKFFDVVGDSALSADELERIYQANRGQPETPAEAIAAEARTRALFAMMQKLGIKPPTHAEDGLPRKSSQPGYAAVYEALVGRQEEEEEESEDEEEDVLAQTRQFDQDGYDEDGYDAEGYDRFGYDREGYNRHGYDKYHRDREGFDVLGFDAAGYDENGFDIEGYDQEGYDQDGYDRAGYDREGYDRGGYDRDGYDQDGNRHAFFVPDENGVYGDGRDKYGFDAEGYNEKGYDRNGFDRTGYNRHGYNIEGRNRKGYDIYGEDPDGYKPEGYKRAKDGHDRDRFGFDKLGHGPDGYTITGYDKNGRDRDGKRRELRYTRGKSGKRLKANFCKSGWDQDGYDRWGFHKDDGLTAPDEETGHRRNWMGWIYDPDEQVCYNPDNPDQKMAWKIDYEGSNTRTKYIKPNFRSRYQSGGILTDDDLHTGRRIPIRAPDYTEMGKTYTAPPEDEIDPHRRLSFGEYRKTKPRYYSDQRARTAYEEDNTNGKPTSESQKAYVRERWQNSEARAKAGGDLVTVQGRRLRCPHCGQYARAGTHRCPSMQGKNIYTSLSGRTFTPRKNQPVFDPDIPQVEEVLEYPDGYSIYTGYDRDGRDRTGYNEQGYDKEGYDREGYDRLGYDRDGYDRQGYDRQGLDRDGKRKPATLETVGPMMEQEEDLLNNEDLAGLYSRVATGLVGEHRQVELREGAGFGTDMKGKIIADPYPLGRDADPRKNLVVTRAGIHHELGHELFTDPEQWAQVLEVAKGDQDIEGLSEQAARILPSVFNVVEDGRMERALSRRYAGVSEVLAASCRLEERWDGEVGDKVPVANQLFGAALYRSLPFFRSPDEDKKSAMHPTARELYEKFEPLIDRAVRGSSRDAFETAVTMASMMDEAGLLKSPDRQSVKLPPLPQPPAGTKATREKSRGESSGKGRGRPPTGARDEERTGRRSGGKSQEEPSGKGRGRPGTGAQEDETGRGRAVGSDEEDADQSGRRQGASQEEASGGKRGRQRGAQEEEERQGRKPGQSQDDQPKDGRAGPQTDFQDSEGGGQGQEEEGEGQGGMKGGTQFVDPDYRPLSDADLEQVLDDVERESSKAIERGVRRRLTPVRVGQQLHNPLPGDKPWAKQTYYNANNQLTSTEVDFPKSRNAKLVKELSRREEKHKKVARLLSRQLERVREQAAVRLSRQTKGKLDRRQLVNAYKGLDDVRSQIKKKDKTSFAVSIAVDQSGSMNAEIRNLNLYDAAMTLSQTLEQLEMAYEVRGFGSSNVQYKAMDDPNFAPARSASLAEITLGGTNMEDTAGLAAQSLLAREESNRLFVSLTDGALGDHQETVAAMKKARQKGIITFGIYLGSSPTVSRMDEIYGRGNWTTISQLSDMPKKVGQRIASIFKSLR